mgnify:CR=1 FL=1
MPQYYTIKYNNKNIKIKPQELLYLQYICCTTPPKIMQNIELTQFAKSYAKTCLLEKFNLKSIIKLIDIYNNSDLKFL